VSDEIGNGYISVAWYKGILAIIISNPIQFVFELLCIYLVKIKISGIKASENLKILIF